MIEQPAACSFDECGANAATLVLLRDDDVVDESGGLSSLRILALPDLEQAKSAVLNTLTSNSGQLTYDHAVTEFVEWYCSKPRLAFNRNVVLRYRISLEQRQYAPSTINLHLAAVRRTCL